MTALLGALVLVIAVSVAMVLVAMVLWVTNGVVGMTQAQIDGG